MPVLLGVACLGMVDMDRLVQLLTLMCCAGLSHRRTCSTTAVHNSSFIAHGYANGPRLSMPTFTTGWRLQPRRMR